MTFLSLDPAAFAVVLAGGFGAALVSGTIGFGGGLLFLPVLVWAVGLRPAVPLLTLCLLASNGSRLGLNWRSMDWNAFLWFSLGALPGAAVGAWFFARASISWLPVVLGVVLIAMVVSRWVGRDLGRLPSRPWLIPVGVVTGATSAMVGGVGPFVSPFFLALGLVKESFIATEAACAIVMHVAKTALYGHGGLVDGNLVLLAVAVAPMSILGSYVAKRVLSRTAPAVFVRVVEVALVGLGVYFVFGHL